MVSEFMLQQTPVERVREPWARWLERWPTPATSPPSPSGEAVRAWGRLGYPRRALRLHGAAVAITERFGGRVPDDLDELRSLPGVGSYTAAAVASFAYGRRAVVLDTNVRRVLGRVAVGEAYPGAAQTRAEVGRGGDVPARRAGARRPLGGRLDGARRPRLHGPRPALRRLPGHRRLRLAAGRLPGLGRSAAPGQSYEGTDRQCRGALLAVLRGSDEPVAADELGPAWPDPVQRERALASLVTDGLRRQPARDDGPLVAARLTRLGRRGGRR